MRSRSPSSYEDADELEALRNERDRLQRSIRHLTVEIPPALESTVVDPHDLSIPESIEEAIDLAREHLFNVEIPDGAVRDVAELDATPKYRVWGSAVWQALLALNDYVGAKRHGEQPAGFYLWCDRTNAWPTAKLAMSESDTVENNPRLRDQRQFPVSEEVDPSGRIHMFAHLKIQAGGGDNIPRLYFMTTATVGPARCTSASSARIGTSATRGADSRCQDAMPTRIARQATPSARVRSWVKRAASRSRRLGLVLSGV